MRSNDDVCVIGGGAIGAMSALELARRGFSVTLIERGDELGAGCSAGPAGLLCPSHCHPLATRAALRRGLRFLVKRDGPFALRARPSLAPWLLRFVRACNAEKEEAGADLIRSMSVAGLALHAEMAGLGLDTGFERKGSLNVFETEARLQSDVEHAAASKRAAGIEFEVLSRDEIRQFEPALSAGTFVGGIFFGDEALCEPLRFVRSVGDAAREAGVQIKLRTEVKSIRAQTNRLASVETTDGDLHPGNVVLAAGAWTAQLARSVGVSMPLLGGKGYHVDLPSGSGDPHTAIFMQEAHVVAAPLVGRVRLAGTLDLCGLDMTIDRKRVDGIRHTAERGINGLVGRGVTEVWAGLRPCAPDGLPIVGRTPKLENLVVATGHAMMGITMAPVTARHVAGILSGDESDPALEQMRPDRFQSVHAAS